MRAGQNDDRCVLGRAEVCQRLIELLDQWGAERIESLWPVQGDWIDTC